MMDYDVAVVGGGPAGLLCAGELESLGERAAVFEKGRRIGESVECAGLFNIEGVKRLGIGKGDYILNEVRGARFISASGASAEIKGKENKAYVVDRGRFDRFLAGRCEAELLLGEEITGLRKSKGGWTLARKKREFTASQVVLATGHEQALHQEAGLEGPSEFIATAQHEMGGVKTDPDFVEIYLGSVAPGFFAWVIPSGEGTARIGLGVMGSDARVGERMAAFLKRLKSEGKLRERSEVLRKSGGLIPVFEPGLGLSQNGAYLVGDAAGHVKATTGGGVIMGGLAAKALARAIHRGLDYEPAVSGITGELKTHLVVRRVINRFGDEQYEHMVEFLNKSDIRGVIEEKGDMDLIGPVLKGVMSNPLLAMKAMKFLGRGILF